MMNTRVEQQAFGQPVVIVDRPMPDLPPAGAIVKVTDAGICHSDAHIQDGFYDLGNGEKMEAPYKIPLVMGHEIAGEIYQLGKEVEMGSCKFNLGDKVIVFPWNGCLDCEICTSGNWEDCPNVAFHSNGLGIDGGFQQFLAVPKLDSLVPLPSSLSSELCCLLPCSGFTPYRSVMKVKPAIEQSISATGKADLLIVGAGGLGLWGIQIAKAIMPKGTRIVCAECSETKFEVAREAGADVNILWDPKATPQENAARAKEIMTSGAHGGVDFVGTTGTTSSLFYSMAFGSTMVPVGLFGGYLNVPLPLLVVTRISIIGVCGGTLQDLEGVLQLVLEGKVRGPPITQVRMEDIQSIIDDLRRGAVRGRCVVKIP